MAPSSGLHHAAPLRSAAQRHLCQRAKCGKHGMAGRAEERSGCCHHIKGPASRGAIQCSAPEGARGIFRGIALAPAAAIRLDV